MLNINKKWRDERTREMTELLFCRSQLPEKSIKNIVGIMLDAEYRKERHGKWVLDASYTGKKYVRWVCTSCGHWQSAQRHDVSEQIFYMNYCPFCGAQMDKPERERAREK